jgi:nucleotide-binding universal stress UspA family protein
MKPNIQHILLPTDFSEPAEKARDYGIALAGANEALLHVLYVSEPFPVPDATVNYASIEEPVTPRVLADVQNRLAQLMKDCGIPASQVVCAARIGNPIVEILKYANEQNIDLIVMGTHGRTGLAHALIGSVAEKIVRTANCPVLTVHPRGHQFVIQ